MSCAYNSISVAKSPVVVYFTSVSPRNVTSRLQSNKLDSVPIRIILFRLASLPSCHCAEFWDSGPPNWLLSTSCGGKRKKKNQSKIKGREITQNNTCLTSFILLGLASIFFYLLQSSVDFYTNLSTYLLDTEKEGKRDKEKEMFIT